MLRNLGSWEGARAEQKVESSAHESGSHHLPSDPAQCMCPGSEVEGCLDRFAKFAIPVLFIGPRHRSLLYEERFGLRKALLVSVGRGSLEARRSSC